MIGSLSLLFASLACISDFSHGFVPSKQSASSSSAASLLQARRFVPKPSSASLLQASTNRVSKVGGGIPIVPSGDRLLFDPAQEGMLGGTEALNDRLTEGPNYYLNMYLPNGASTSTETTNCQAWLEDLGIPAPFAKATKPVTATVLGRAKLIEDSAPGDIQHVVLKLPEGFHYIEGQSLSVIPPGINPKTNKSHNPRLYSIASTRYGDLLDGTTVSLCVRRAGYMDPATGVVDPAKEGVCSNFLCSALPGSTVQVAGPVGKTMVLPEDPTTDIIMVATGTGIAPFRAFMQRLFMEETVARHQFQGKAWLVLGVPVTGGLLYPQEFSAMLQNHPDSLEVTYAISREMQNRQGGKLYVQDALTERADDLMSRLDNGAHIYFCGLKGMMPGILDALEQVAVSKGLDWSTKLKGYKDNHQWHVEVY
jgi:ferredoxin--NADP+ reductase